jgi:outer membrane protein
VEGIVLTTDHSDAMPKRVFILCCVAVLWTPAPAQITLGLDSCVALAKAHNLGLQISGADARSAELLRSEFSTSTLPSVSVKSGASYAPSSRSFGYDPVATNQGELSAGLEVDQTLYDGGARGLRADRLGLGVERSWLERRMTERDLVYAVREAFIGVLRNQEEIGLRQESVEQLREYLGLVERLAAQGAGSSTDVLKTRIQLSNAGIALRDAAGAAAVSKLALSELMGTPIDTAFSAAGSLGDLLGPAPDTSATPGTIDPSLNMDARISELGIRQSELDAEIAKRGRYPSVSLFGNVGFLTSVENLRLPSDQRFSTVGVMAGLSLELPVFDWGGTGLRIEEAQLALETARMRSALLRRSIGAASSGAVLQLAAARGRLRSLRDNVKAAEDHFLLTKALYAGGGTTSLEVLGAQQMVSDARAAELGTLAEIQLLLAKLDQLSAQ